MELERIGGWCQPFSAALDRQFVCTSAQSHRRYEAGDKECMEPVVKPQVVGTIQYIQWLILADRVQPSFIAGVLCMGFCEMYRCVPLLTYTGRLVVYSGWCVCHCSRHRSLLRCWIHGSGRDGSVYIDTPPCKIPHMYTLCILQLYTQCAVSSQPPTIITHMFSMGD
jgi:hypothetical protein